MKVYTVAFDGGYLSKKYNQSTTIPENIKYYTTPAPAKSAVTMGQKHSYLGPHWANARVVSFDLTNEREL